MEDLIPSANRENELALDNFLAEGDLKELLLEKARLQSRMKEIDEMIKEKKELVHELMATLDIQEYSISDQFYIRNVLPFTRAKMMSVTELRKKHPELVEKLVTDVEVNGYIQIKSK